MTDEKQMVVGRYKAGNTDDADELNKLIHRVWAEAIDDPRERAQIAAILKLPADKLSSAPPPVIATISESGLTGAEVLIAFGTGFLLGAAKEAGAGGGKVTVQAAKKVWAVLRRRLQSTESDALGDEVTSDDG